MRRVEVMTPWLTGSHLMRGGRFLEFVKQIMILISSWLSDCCTSHSNEFGQYYLLCYLSSCNCQVGCWMGSSSRLSSSWRNILKMTSRRSSTGSPTLRGTRWSQGRQRRSRTRRRWRWRICHEDWVSPPWCLTPILPDPGSKERNLQIRDRECLPTRR